MNLKSRLLNDQDAGASKATAGDFPNLSFKELDSRELMLCGEIAILVAVVVVYIGCVQAGECPPPTRF